MASKAYRGPREFVVCQATDGDTRLCMAPVRTTGVGMIAGRPARLYECVHGHRFGISDRRPAWARGDTGEAGELDADASGESPNSPSGESRNSPSRLGSYRFIPTDDRRVTMFPGERPTFGSRPI